MLLMPISLLALLTPALSPLDAYALRGKVAKAVDVAMVDARTDVTVFRLTNDRWPADAAEAGIPADKSARPDLGVASIEVRSGTIVLTLGGDTDDRLKGLVIGISPCGNAEQAIWACGVAACPSMMPPSNDGPTASAITTVARELLPARCR